MEKKEKKKGFDYLLSLRIFCVRNSRWWLTTRDTGPSTFCYGDVSGGSQMAHSKARHVQWTISPFSKFGFWAHPPSLHFLRCIFLNCRWMHVPSFSSSASVLSSMFSLCPAIQCSNFHELHLSSSYRFWLVLAFHTLASKPSSWGSYWNWRWTLTTPPHNPINSITHVLGYKLQ